jgi:hypothetical protein
MITPASSWCYEGGLRIDWGDSQNKLDAGAGLTGTLRRENRLNIR